jgi:putative addiction module component (TIGR02574 family)
MPPPGFDALTVEEQIDYVQSLWDHIATHPEQVPVPDWHRKVLAERIASYQANPDEGKGWEEAENEIPEELRRQSE